MSFFADEPVRDVPDGEEPVRDPRRGPSEDELPAILSMGMRWATSVHAVVVLESARVFSDGVLFEVSRYLRRGDLTSRQFQQLVNDDRFSRDDDDEPRRRLRFGAVLPDGQQIVDRRFPDSDESAEQSVLFRRGGSGGGGASRYRHSDELWLHPLPPEGQLNLVTQWLAVDVPETRLAVSATELVRAVEQVCPLWRD